MRSFFIALCLSGLAWADPRLEPVGRWKIFHSDGQPIFVTVQADGRCQSTWENETGTWKLDHGRLLLNWTDGWRDVIEVRAGKFRKRGYAPKAALEGKPSNETAAFKEGRK